LSFMKDKQFSQTDNAVLFIEYIGYICFFIFENMILVKYYWGLQICEQISEKKNQFAIEYLIFFPHAKYSNLYLAK